LLDYLKGLDLEMEDITSMEELLRHLQAAAAENGFTMEDVRQAMIDALDHELEVDRVYRELLASTDGEIREILKSLDLQKQGIFTVEDLVKAVFDALVAQGYSPEEIREILESLFPGYEDLINELMLQAGKGERGKGFSAVMLMIILGGLSILIFIILFRRRKRKE
jgi:AcrR family transcriptional regulator